MFQTKINEFKCEYCSKSFSKCSSFQNHLRSYHNVRYLDEIGLSREENTTGSSSLLNISSQNHSQELTLNTSSQEYDIFKESLDNEQDMLVDDYLHEKVT
jgi:hypothetical protein